MTNIITAAFVLIFFFGFVFNSSNWVLRTMSTEKDILDKHAKQYKDQNNSLIDPKLNDLKIGELE